MLVCVSLFRSFMKEQLYQLLVEEHRTLREVGEILGLSRQRVHQLRQQFFPNLERKDFGCGKRNQKNREEASADFFNKYGRTSFKHQSDLSEAFSRAFSRKKQNSKVTGWSWEIGFTDVDWNTVCPILGIELDWFAESRQENSPSFDRIDSSKGYVKGNVQIISWRANRIKNDGTAEEHRKIAEYLDKIQHS